MANARPAYNGVTIPGGAAYQSRCRQVATFNGVSQYVSIPPITLSGDFEFEAKVVINDISKDFALLGNTVAGINPYVLFYHDAPDGWRWMGYDGSGFVGVNNTGVIAEQGREYLIIAKRTGSVFALLIDVVVVYTGVDSLNTYQNDALFRHEGGKYPNGRVWDIKLWSGGDRNTGTLVRDYPLDDGYANNPVVRDLASSQHGTMINGTEAMWSERCDL
jgi:hypothetical protein